MNRKNKISRIEVLDNGLRVTWIDDARSFFHFIWLRDCCYCEICGDSYSSNRYFLPTDINLDCRPQSARINKLGDLEIDWLHEQHSSIYQSDWLRRYRYDREARSHRFHKPKNWDHRITSRLPTLEFASVREREASKFELYRMLRDLGFVIVKEGAGTPGFVQQVAELIGDLGVSAYSRIFDLKPGSHIKTLGNTIRPVPPHTDEAFRYTPPGINVLGCVRPAEEGGDSILVDGFNLAEILRSSYPEAFDLLAGTAQSFHRIHPGELDQRARQRIFALDDRGEVVGVRVHTRSAGPLDIDSGIVEDYYDAYRRLCQLMLMPENQVRFRLESGDTVLFDNHRILHARHHFTDQARHLQICNVPRESFHEQYRLLANKLGHKKEADLILSGGMTV